MRKTSTKKYLFHFAVFADFLEQVTTMCHN